MLTSSFAISGYRNCRHSFTTIGDKLLKLPLTKVIRQRPILSLRNSVYCHSVNFVSTKTEASADIVARERFKISLLSSKLRTMKLETPSFKVLFTPELNTLIELFNKYGYELRIAGGAVRDLMLGKVPNDVDFATTATPDEMKAMFEKENIRIIHTKGESHGTITCRINEKVCFQFELRTRTTVWYTFDFLKFCPGSVN